MSKRSTPRVPVAAPATNQPPPPPPAPPYHQSPSPGITSPTRRDSRRFTSGVTERQFAAAIAAAAEARRYSIPQGGSGRGVSGAASRRSSEMAPYAPTTGSTNLRPLNAGSLRRHSTDTTTSVSRKGASDDSDNSRSAAQATTRKSNVHGTATPPLVETGNQRPAVTTNEASPPALASRRNTIRVGAGGVNTTPVGGLLFAANAAATEEAAIRLSAPKIPPHEASAIYESVRRSSDVPYDTSPSPSLLDAVRLAHLRQNSSSEDTTNNATLSRPTVPPGSKPPSAFVLPPLAEELDLSRRYSNLTSTLGSDTSIDSMKLKSALKTGEKSASKRTIRFDDSVNTLHEINGIPVVKEKPAILWVVGPPAVGKNTLCNYIQSELQKRQTTCSILNWPLILSRNQRNKSGASDITDVGITNSVTTALQAKKQTNMDIVIINNFPLNISQAILFEQQAREPDLILSLTASQRALESRWTGLHRKPLTHQLFAHRTEKYYREVDPVLERYKPQVITIDAEERVAMMWERVRELLVAMGVIQGKSVFT